MQSYCCLGLELAAVPEFESCVAEVAAPKATTSDATGFADGFGDVVACEAACSSGVAGFAGFAAGIEVSMQPIE